MVEERGGMRGKMSESEELRSLSWDRNGNLRSREAGRILVLPVLAGARLFVR